MRIRAIAIAAAALVPTACIERATNPGDRRQAFDRGTVGDLIVSGAPSGARAVGASFEGPQGQGRVELASVVLSPPNPRPGQGVNVTFYFRVLEGPEEDFKVFVHVDDRGGRSERLNGDHMPARGRYPMSLWRPGELVRDEWSFTIPSYFDAEVLDLWTGFYHPIRGDRMTLKNSDRVTNDGQNRVLAASINLRGT